jgi:hypothetical protein
MCHDGRKIQEYFARKKLTRVPYPVSSPDLSPWDFRFFGYAQEQMIDSIIRDEDDLEKKLTEVWEPFTWDVLQSIFHELIVRLEWVIRHGGDCYLNLHEQTENAMRRYHGEQGVMTFVPPYIPESRSFSSNGAVSTVNCCIKMLPSHFRRSSTSATISDLHFRCSPMNWSIDDWFTSNLRSIANQ